jgi:hypothetical protein
MYYEGTDKMSLRHLSCVTTTAGSTEGEYAMGINPDDLDPLISSHARTLYVVASRANNRMDVKWALGTLHINTLDQYHACRGTLLLARSFMPAGAADPPCDEGPLLFCELINFLNTFKDNYFRGTYERLQRDNAAPAGNENSNVSHCLATNPRSTGHSTQMNDVWPL